MARLCRQLWLFSIMILYGRHVVVRAWLLQPSSTRSNQLCTTRLRGVVPPRRWSSTTMRPLFFVVASALPSCSRSSSTRSRSRRTRSSITSVATTTSSTAQDNNESSTLKVPRNFQPYPFDYWQELDVTIETLTNRGLGIARVEVPPKVEEEEEIRDNSANSNDENAPAATLLLDNKKWVIMVPNVIPGERVRVRIFRNFPKYSEADLVQVLEASKDRVKPVCDLATICGGCQFQHMSIEAQRKYKTLHVQEALEQYGIADNVVVSSCLGTNETLQYRSKLTPHYQQPSKSRRGKSNTDDTYSDDTAKATTTTIQKYITAIGFQKQSARQIIDVPSCPIATPEVNQAYQRVREKLLQEPPQSKKGATLLFRQANLGDDYVETNHKKSMTTTVRGLEFTYRAGNFFQNNYYVLPLMIDHVLEQAITKLGNSNDDDDDGVPLTHLADCYCGSGLFALSAAQHFERVVGIEINDMAIAEATANAVANNISNCEFKASSAETIFDVIQDFPRNQTVMVLDPPRKGCSPDFLEQLYDFNPQRIVYMSCDPTTQARDAAGMVQAGYKITSVQPFDLFPQTRHIECLMVLERRRHD